MSCFRKAFFRPRVKTMLFFSVFLMLLCFITVMFPSTSELRRSYHEEQSVLVENRRSEYYILNRDFFEFLARTSMECLIQIEPGKELSGEASVKTKLSDSSSSEDRDNKKPSEEQLSSTAITRSENHPPDRYILAYKHFEQLGKTTENLIQLAALGKRWRRNVVKPDVQNSRFSLEFGFRSYPLDIYFNMSSINDLLYSNGYSKLVELDNFLRDCNYANSAEKTTVIHFLYGDVHRGNTMAWFHLKRSQLQDILNKSLLSDSGWTECPFIDKHLTLAKSLKGIKIGRQLCVNPEVVLSETKFGENILGNDKCVVFVEWRGFGKARTHFSPSYSPYLSPREIKHQIASSHLIDREVINFKLIKLTSPYISVHLRSERLLSRHSIKKLQLCIDHVVHLVGILRELRRVNTVFLATDMTRFGSDAFDRRSFYTSISNATGSSLVNRKDIARIHEDVVKRLNSITYEPLEEPFSKDKGIVSLVEMNILKGGLDLVTVGSGTFHSWLVSVFREHQKHYRRRGYTISEVCSDGSK